jgi:peptidoglycan-N-acetylglucosamine deacetylase
MSQCKTLRQHFDFIGNLCVFKLESKSHKCINMVRLILSAATLLSLFSCSPQRAQDQTFEKQIEFGIIDNAESATHKDWETSDYHPQFVFGNLRKSFDSLINPDQIVKLKKEACTTLGNLSDDTLLIYENEILDEDNSEILSNCLTQLQNKLNNKNKLNRLDFKYSRDALSDDDSDIDFALETKIIDSADYINFGKYNANVQDKEVILTFDDGPHSKFTSSVLRTLREAGQVKAMFFELGKQIKKFPEHTLQADDEGHIVANHSWSHSCMDDSTICKNNNKGKVLTDKEVATEITDTFDLIKKLIGKINPFFRFPYGDSREVTSKYLKDQGILEMHWSIDSNDWRYVQKIGSESIPFTSKEVMNSALRTLDKNNKGVVLFHDIHRRTAEILPQFLYELHKRNFKVVILDPKNQSTK